jgi:hypothetical protein
LTLRTGDDLGAKRPDGEIAADNGEAIKCLDRCVGIVDRWRQSLAADVDLLPDAECDVLLDGALEANPDIGGNRFFKGLGSGRGVLRRGRPNSADDRSTNHMLTHPFA